jgi:hypothetical protein
VFRAALVGAAVLIPLWLVFYLALPRNPPYD